MTDPATFGSDGCTCRPFTADPPRYLQPADTTDPHTSWQRGKHCPHHPAKADRDDETDADAGRTQPAADMQRVTALYNRWVKAGPPRLGTPIARWRDARLGELHNTIHPPAEQPSRTIPNNPPTSKDQ